jgi:hypothetical protein
LILEDQEQFTELLIRQGRKMPQLKTTWTREPRSLGLPELLAKLEPLVKPELLAKLVPLELTEQSALLGLLVKLELPDKLGPLVRLGQLGLELPEHPEKLAQRVQQAQARQDKPDKPELLALPGRLGPLVPDLQGRLARAGLQERPELLAQAALDPPAKPVPPGHLEMTVSLVLRVPPGNRRGRPLALASPSLR